MKTTLFEYRTDFGTFWIRPEPAGRVQLGLDRNKLRTYRSATEAARAVTERATGWTEWDHNAPNEAIPASLRKWKRPPETPGAKTRRAAKASAETD